MQPPAMPGAFGPPRPGFPPGPGFPPPPPGAPLPNGVTPPMPGAPPPPRPFGAPSGFPPPPGAPMGGPPGMPGVPPPGAPPPPGALPPQGATPLVSSFQQMSINTPSSTAFPPPPGSMGGMPRPLGPPGQPGLSQVPSSGLPIPMGTTVSPPSQASGALVGLPPPGPPGGMAAAHRPPGMLMGMPPPPPGMGPPAPLSMMPPGMPPPPPGPPGPPGPQQHMGPPPPAGFHAQPPGPPGPPGPAPPGAPQPITQPQRSGGGTNRTDPSQIPRPVAQPVSAEPAVFDTRAGGGHMLPPPASARFVVRDRGSCGPRYVRSTLNNMPCSAELLNNSAMPLAVVVSPLALPDPGDEPIQVVDTSDVGPVRCVRCKAYMNPWMRFNSSGRHFTCNFCGLENPTPDHYFCHLGPDGRRRDADERPELCKGTVEYLAPKEYIFRPPQAPAHVFLIDVSQPAIATGVTASLCRAVSAALDGIQGGDRALVGLATYDSTIHFYAIRSPSATPQMLVVSDVHDVYAPTSGRLLMPVSEVKEQLQALLDSIPDMWAQSRINENCAGAAIEAAVDLLKPTGGKVHAFLAALPSIGLHALKQRDGMSVGDKDKLTYLHSQDNTLRSLATTAADHMVSIDLSFLGQAYCDVASLADLASTTGGSVYSYMPFNPLMDFDQLVNDLRWNVSRLQGLEAVMRVRCSTGIDVESYSGHCYRPPNTPDVYLPAIDCDKALLARLQLLEKLSPGSEAYVQAALLYTSTSGQRIIRVHTLALPITDNVSTVFKGADLDAQINSLGRRLTTALTSQTLAACRELVTNSTVATLYAYRKYCASNSSAVQLILPEALKLLPLFALSLLKSNGLKDSVKADDRALWITQMSCLPCARIAPLLYPRLLQLTGLLSEAKADAQVPDGNTFEGITLSSEHLEAGGVSLLENGQEALLYLDRGVNPGLLQDLLGVASYEELLRQPHAVALRPRGNPASDFLAALINKIRLQRSSYMRLRVARKGDPAEVAFFNMLVEDRSSAGMSYVEYLCQVHRLIQNKMS